jgi:DNA-binding GntR family transcriptional regulator
MGTSHQTTQHTAKANHHSSVKAGGALVNGSTSHAASLGAYADLQNVAKSDLQRIAINQLPKEIPDFQTAGASKDSLIAHWLKRWIETSMASATLTEENLLPRKADIAKYLGVSVGTVQNAIRFVEDEGYVESKQRIGTLIRDPQSDVQRMRKQTSKRDQAYIAVKQLIIDSALKPGQPLPSAREIAKHIGSAPNTTRLALELLSSEGTLQNLGSRGNKANWILRETPTISADEIVQPIESETLIDQLERDLKILLSAQFEVNEKLPSHLDLSKQLKVSIKTVHDAMRRLAEQGIVASKRGRYGTYLVRKPDSTAIYQPGVHGSVFVPVDQQPSILNSKFYNYERVESSLKNRIATQCKVGDRLPAMSQLAEDLQVSSNTVRKALQNLGNEGYVKFTRGRFGGTFVEKLPTATEADKPFQWVSINPEALKTYAKVD